MTNVINIFVGISNWQNSDKNLEGSKCHISLDFLVFSYHHYFPFLSLFLSSLDTSLSDQVEKKLKGLNYFTMEAEPRLDRGWAEAGGSRLVGNNKKE